MYLSRPRIVRAHDTVTPCRPFLLHAAFLSLGPIVAIRTIFHLISMQTPAHHVLAPAPEAPPVTHLALANTHALSVILCAQVVVSESAELSEGLPVHEAWLGEEALASAADS